MYKLIFAIIVYVFSIEVHADESFNFIQLSEQIPEFNYWQDQLKQESFKFNPKTEKNYKPSLEYNFFTPLLKKYGQTDNDFLRFAAMNNSAVYFESDFNLKRDDFFNVPGTVKRILNNTDLKNQIFREKIYFNLPGLKKDYKFLSFAIINDNYPFWIYSPFTKEIRKASSANRGDLLFSSNVSINDLFAWSSNSANYVVSNQTDIKASLPLINSNLTKRSISNCEQYRISINETNKLEIILFDSAMIRYSLASKNVFSKSGRQVIYFSTGGIPLFRFVFDELDRPAKLLINLINKNGIILKTLIFDQKLKSSIEYKKFMHCAKIPADVKYSDFDPSKL